MEIILGFSPWILFWMLAAHYSVTIAAGLSFALSLVVSIRSFLKGRHPKILEIGALAFLASLTIVSLFIKSHAFWKCSHLMGNATFLLISLLSIVFKKPFVIQYAHEEVPKEKWSSPKFYRVCLVITWAWTVLFFFMTLSSIGIFFWKHRVPWLIWTSHTVAFTSVMAFTRYYKARAVKSGVN